VILYTPVQLEIVLGEQGLDMPKPRQVLVDGVPVLVREAGPGRGRIDRLLSTDPQDYLRPGLAPGTQVIFEV
jgi:hypothetical protein